MFTEAHPDPAPHIGEVLPGVETNRAAMDALFDELIPPETREEPEAPPVPPTEAEVAEVAKLSALAQNPRLGDEFKLGGKSFRRQYLSMDAEEGLIALIRQALSATPAGKFSEVMLSSGPMLRQAAEIILVDQDPTADMAWMRSSPRDIPDAITTRRLMLLVVSQMELNETTPFLIELLALAARATQFGGQKAPG